MEVKNPNELSELDRSITYGELARIIGACSYHDRSFLMRPDVRTKFGRATGLPSLRSQSCEISSDFSMTEDRGVSVVGASFVSSRFLCLSRSEKILSNIFSSRTVKKKRKQKSRCSSETQRCLTEDVWAYSFMNSWHYRVGFNSTGRHFVCLYIDCEETRRTVFVKFGRTSKLASYLKTRFLFLSVHFYFEMVASDFKTYSPTKRPPFHQNVQVS